MVASLVAAVVVVAATVLGAGAAAASSRVAGSGHRAVASRGIPAAAGSAGRGTSEPTSRHVVVVGISGLRWSDVSARATPTLWRLAKAGSVGSLVNYAVVPRTCPADGWLTLGAGNRAQLPHTESGPCPSLPAVDAAASRRRRPAPARVPAMRSLVAYNKRFHYDPHWGLLAAGDGTSAGNCATAVGPGAALALAEPTGRVGNYLPSATDLNRRALARCPLTVIDLGALPATSGPQATSAAARTTALHHADTELAAVTAELPADTTVLVTSPGTLGLPHLGVAVVDGPGYHSGLLQAASTRQSGLVVLTDLTPTVLRWRGRPPPAGLPGSTVTRTGRTSLNDTVRRLVGQDTAAQVWTGTHLPFFLGYGLATLAVLAGVGLLLWGTSERRRRRRAACWRVAGVFAGAVPAGTFLASLVPWWQLGHPALWLYGMAAGWAALVGAVALAGPWRRDPLGPPGVVAAVTVAVIAVDVTTGSRLQLGTPFGLSVLEAGRYYGIGNWAVGIYAVCAILAVGWLGGLVSRRGSRGLAVLTVALFGAFAVIACGWPGFGAKVGGTIALVPGLLLLVLRVAGVRITARRVVLVLASGVALFAVFALVNHFVPATGHSDIGAFAGNFLHGRAGGLLDRKVTSMLGSLNPGLYSPLVPVVLVAAGILLVRPSWFAARALDRGCHTLPLLQTVLAVMLLVAVLGWFADDSGIVVAATALPVALPLAIAVLAAFPSDGRDGRRGTAAATGCSIVDSVS